MTAPRFSLAVLSTAAITALAAIALFPGKALAETPIYSFDLGYDGVNPNAGPYGGLVEGKHGTLYGTTVFGGEFNASACQFGCGIVFELIPPTISGGAWTETVLYSFSGEPDGSEPYGNLIFDADGNLYGTTQQGGSSDRGTVFELSPPTASGGAWTEAVLYSFESGEGYPVGGLVFGWKGSLYGTTISGGFSIGTVFRLAKSKTGWDEVVIHSFNGADGREPNAGLIADKAGNLYGTTAEGGSGPCFQGCGVAFELSPPVAQGAGWSETVLHSFTGVGNGDGFAPVAPLIFDSAGNLYGTTGGGGETGVVPCGYGCGTVFEFSPAGGGGWTESVLYSFTGGSDGAYPVAGLVFDSAGNLYGTTAFGGGTFRRIAKQAAAERCSICRLQLYPAALGARRPFTSSKRVPKSTTMATSHITTL